MYGVYAVQMKGVDILHRSWIPFTILVCVAFCYLVVDYIFWSFVVICFFHILWINIKPKDTPKTENPDGKYVLITGCDSGFGKKFAIRAHKIGFTVFAGCHDNDSEGARELAKYDTRMHVMKIDVTSDQEVNSALKYISRLCEENGLWAVVNGVDVAGGGPVELCSIEHYQHVCTVNLIGAIRVTKTFISLVRQAKGRFINVSSERGLLSKGRTSSYSVSKYGLETFSDSLRQEMKKFDVQVSLLEMEEQYTHVQVQRLGRRLFEEFYSAPEDVQKAYPWNDVERMVNDKYESIRRSRLSSSEVLDVIQQQLINTRILPRYLVLGKMRRRTEILSRIILLLKKYLSNLKVVE